MSGENRRMNSWFLPVLVVAAGAYFLVTSLQNGTLNAVTIKPVGWVGLVLMAVGVGMAFVKKPIWKLAGVLLCGIGAIMVICI